MFDSTSIALAALGIVSTVVLALIWIIKYLFTSFKPAVDQLVVSVETNTKATLSADTYLRERNGRDSELWKQNTQFHNTVIDGLRVNHGIMVDLRERSGVVDAQNAELWRRNIEFHNEALSGLQGLSIQSQDRANVVAEELKKQTAVVASALKLQAREVSKEFHLEADKVAKELKRVGDATAERVEQVKEQREQSTQHQTVIEQNVEHQTVDDKG